MHTDTGRHKHRHRHEYKHRPAYKGKHAYRHRQTCKNRHTNRHGYKQCHMHTDTGRHAYRHRLAYRQTCLQTQTDMHKRDTDIHTHTHTHTHRQPCNQIQAYRHRQAYIQRQAYTHRPADTQTQAKIKAIFTHRLLLSETFDKTMAVDKTSGRRGSDRQKVSEQRVQMVRTGGAKPGSLISRLAVSPPNLLSFSKGGNRNQLDDELMLNVLRCHLTY